MKKNNKLIIILFIIIGLVIVLSVPVFKGLGNYLVVNDKLKPVDVIVVLSGEREGVRVAKGVELYKQGYAKRLLVSGCKIAWQTNEADIMRKQAIFSGVPQKVILVDREGSTTFANAKNTLEIMEKLNLKSAVIVSSSYHTRRVKLIFSRIFDKSGIELVYAVAPDEDFTPDAWWKNENATKLVFYEYVKLFFYTFRYGE